MRIGCFSFDGLRLTTIVVVFDFEPRFFFVRNVGEFKNVIFDFSDSGGDESPMGIFLVFWEGEFVVFLGRAFGDDNGDILWLMLLL